MNKFYKIFQYFLIISLAGSIGGISLTVAMFVRYKNNIETNVNELSLIFMPATIGYIVSLGMGVGCLFLSFFINPNQISSKTKRTGIILSWLNAVNGFPIGLIAACLFQMRVWKKVS